MNGLKLLIAIFFAFSSILCFGQEIEFRTNGRSLLGIAKERSASIGIGDIDQDGDLDVLVANGRHWPGQNRIFINNGKGIFTVSKPLGLESETSYATELADFDGDGDLDVAVGNDRAPNYIFENDGTGNFKKASVFGKLSAPTRNITLADIDNDGDLDILITNRGSENEICLNDGTGVFSNCLGFGSQSDATIDLAVVDMNGDKHPDLVLANRDKQQNYVYLNDGKLGFKEKIPFGTGSDNTRSVAVADINQDGYLDIITSNVGETNAIYFGDAELTYANHIEFDTSQVMSYAVSVDDLDGDGDVDIVVGNSREPNTVFINHKSGEEWERIQLGEESFNTYDVMVADLNGDGRPDIIESNSDELNRYFINFQKEEELEVQRKSLSLKYLGTAGWEMANEDISILVDPYISRLKLGNGPSISEEDTRKSFAKTDHFESDTASINKIIGKVDYILIHHSHFDHLSDVPYIAKKTGAKVIGTETTCNILRAYGIPDSQLLAVKGGEDYQFEHFSVRIIPSLHSALGDKHYFDSRTYTEVPEAPLQINEFIEGGSLMFFIRFESHKILTAGSMNFIEREVQGLQPDVLLPGVNFSRLEIYKYTERLLRATGFPQTIIPAHWDNFRVPYGYSQADAIEKKIKPFIEEVRAVSPESRVLIPVHLETITLTSDH